MNEMVAVILAAGKGTRMKSKRPKVVHPVCGEPMIRHVCRTVKELGARRAILVVGYMAEMVKKAAGPEWEYAYQDEQKGTGHAVMCAHEILKDYQGDILVLYGDTPVLTHETLQSLMEEHRIRNHDVSVLTAIVKDPKGYGHIVRSQAGDVLKIVEDRDASSEEKMIQEINTGIYCFKSHLLWDALREVKGDNQQKEFYLTDVIGILKEKGCQVGSVMTDDPDEIEGINSRIQLAQAEFVMQQKIHRHWMQEGVTMIDPSSTYIEASVTLEPDVVLRPNTMLQGKTHIKEDSMIGPNVRISNSRIGRGVTVENSVVLDSMISDHVNIGPFAYVRPDTVIQEGGKVGTFVEVKKSVIGSHSKVPHLSYVGDGIIGENVNIGAGTIFVNYDSKEKHTAIVEDEAFIGCNANLVAPVVVRKGAYVAAGSTITKEVPAGALGIARARQENLLGWVARRRGKRND